MTHSRAQHGGDVAMSKAESARAWRTKQPEYAYDQMYEDGWRWVRSDRVDDWLESYAAHVTAASDARISAARSIVSALRDYQDKQPTLNAGYVVQELDRVLRALERE